MGRAIIHLGPGKCGSSAIQKHVQQWAQEKNPDFDCYILRRDDIHALRHLAKQDVADRLRNLFRRTVSQGRTLIISHEVLFKLADVRRAVIELAQAETDDISAVAYVRRISDFQRSSYMQWLFRVPERIAETAQVLHAEGINPAVFSGLERHLIAVAMGHAQIGRPRGGPSYFDWSDSVPRLQKTLDEQGVALQLGALPARGAAVPLIADFRARIGLPTVADEESKAVVNPAFSPFVVEAVSAAIESGHSMPGPHEANAFLMQDHIGLEDLVLPDPDFTQVLGAAIDTAYAPGNMQLAEKFGIDRAYFKPSLHVDRNRLAEQIAHETQRRQGGPLGRREAGRASAAAAIAAAWSAYQNR